MSEKSKLSKPKYVVGIIFTALFFCGFLIAILMPIFPARLIAEAGSAELNSDPASAKAVPVFREYFGVVKLPEKNFTAEVIDASPTLSVRLAQKDNILYISSESFTDNTRVRLVVRSEKDRVELEYRLTLSAGDSDSDGYPDAAELGKCQSFREWFAAIAESQFFNPADIWFDVRKDCAGLIEFAYREALKRHTKEWAKNYRYITDFTADDDRKYFYPNVPWIGQRIFRVREGRFEPGSITNDFAVTAQGSVLRTYSMSFVSKNIRDAKKGDILFFFHPENTEMPSHSMIYIGNPSGEDVTEGFLIYHTGPSDLDSGLIKKVRVRDLMNHPDTSWRPVEQNTAFLGVYQWKILD